MGQRISENVKIRNRQKGASDMDEKKKLDLLRKQAEGFEPPESLSPDAIEKVGKTKERDKRSRTEREEKGKGGAGHGRSEKRYR